MKLLRLMYLFLLSLTIGACQKEYSCTCTDDQTGEVVNVSMYELSKEDAISACDNADAAAGVTCVLDQL
ncbi:MAG: hypothetical protein AAGJ18_15095 [Bacteroidota bacterium]